MKSHQTQFTRRDALEVLAGPIVVALLGIVALHALAAMSLLPRPRPTLDIDRTILIHQADAARQGPSAEVVLLGDSSCLMDVDAKQLATLLGRPVLNLGTLSYLDLAAYSQLLSELTRRQKPAAVVLLMHPDALRRVSAETYQLGILSHYLAGRDHSSTAGLADAFNFYAGVDIASGRILSRVLPSPLRGAYGAFYGFSRDLESFMTDHNGSALDPGSEKFSGSAEYRLAPTLAASSAAFRRAVPAGTKLYVGITPVPAGFARDSYETQRLELLQQWAEWLTADAALTNLPARLPDNQFARTTHLKPAAVGSYTESLAAALREKL